jgi:hypothetical protein
MPTSLINGVSVAMLTVVLDTSTCNICSGLEAPEPAHMGEVTADPEKNTFAYNLLDDPDLVGPAPEFSTEAAYVGPVLTEEGKNSWAYRMRRTAPDGRRNANSAQSLSAELRLSAAR